MDDEIIEDDLANECHDGGHGQDYYWYRKGNEGLDQTITRKYFHYRFLYSEDKNTNKIPINSNITQKSMSLILPYNIFQVLYLII